MLVGSGILYCWLVVVGMAGCDNCNCNCNLCKYEFKETKYMFGNSISVRLPFLSVYLVYLFFRCTWDITRILPIKFKRYQCVIFYIGRRIWKKFKESRNRPDVAHRVPGGLFSQIFMTFGTWRWWGCQPHAPATFNPRKCSWYSFSLGAESTPGPWYGWKEYVTEKSSDTTGNRSRESEEYNGI